MNPPRVNDSLFSSPGAGLESTPLSPLTLQFTLICELRFRFRFLDPAHALDEHVRSTLLWEYTANALNLGEYTPTCEALRSVERIEQPDADL